MSARPRRRAGGVGGGARNVRFLQPVDVRSAGRGKQPAAARGQRHVASDYVVVTDQVARHLEAVA